MGVKWAASKCNVRPAFDPYDAPVNGMSREVWDALERLYFRQRPCDANAVRATMPTLKRLAARGCVEAIDDGRWRITDVGRRLVQQHWDTLE